ncbi:MAG: hypothetical protein U5R48_13105 [Gammaproteobacteria bacterium]|nr:hypothetical protein [Gammaproteobacteria bacterium]
MAAAPGLVDAVFGQGLAPRLQELLQTGLGILVDDARPGRLQPGIQQIQDQGAGRALAAVQQ